MFWNRMLNQSGELLQLKCFSLFVRADSRIKSENDKKGISELFLLLAGPEGFEPSPTVLETGMLPLHYGPIFVICITFSSD